MSIIILIGLVEKVCLVIVMSYDNDLFDSNNGDDQLIMVAATKISVTITSVASPGQRYWWAECSTEHWIVLIFLCFQDLRFIWLIWDWFYWYNESDFLILFMQISRSQIDFMDMRLLSEYLCQPFSRAGQSLGNWRLVPQAKNLATIIVAIYSLLSIYSILQYIWYIPFTQYIEDEPHKTKTCWHLINSFRTLMNLNLLWF